MKKTKEKFLVDKSYTTQTQYQDASQEKTTVDKRYAEQPFFHEG